MPTPGTDPVTAASTPGREASAMTASTPDHTAILAAASFEPIPPLPTAVPGPPAMRSSSWSISTTSSMSEPASVRRGSSVSRPAVSVSSTSCSARTRWATRAASRSLSPNRISSSATASFSLTTGTTPRSSSRPRVWRACRYWLRCTKSRGANRTWPAVRPCRPEGVAPHLHQAVLADGGHRLERGQVGRPGPVGGQGGPAGGDRPRGHHHHPEARRPGPRPPPRSACRWRRRPPGPSRW